MDALVGWAYDSQTFALHSPLGQRLTTMNKTTEGVISFPILKGIHTVMSDPARERSILRPSAYTIRCPAVYGTLWNIGHSRADRIHLVSETAETIGPQLSAQTKPKTAKIEHNACLACRIRKDFISRVLPRNSDDFTKENDFIGRPNRRWRPKSRVYEEKRNGFIDRIQP